MKRASLEIKGPFVALIAGLGLAAIPVEANAHLVTTGLGPVYDGVAHFVVSPEAILPVVALAILAGLRGPAHARASVLILPVGWVLSGVVGMALGPLAFNPIFESLPLLILGGLAAADLPLRLWATGLLSVLLGLFEGYIFGSSFPPSRDGVLALVGTASVVFVLVVLVSAAVTKNRWDWTRIAVRVLGSWTAASGMLLLGWGLR